MLKENKGITLIALAVTVLVLLILASIGVSGGIDAIKSSIYYEAVSEIRMLQAKVNEIYEENKTTKKEYGVQANTSDRSSQILQAYSTVKAKNTTGEDIGEINDYRYFSKNYIKETLDLEGIKYDFAVNLKTRTVILIDGFVKDGQICYALCQIEGEQYNV